MNWTRLRASQPVGKPVLGQACEERGQKTQSELPALAQWKTATSQLAAKHVVKTNIKHNRNCLLQPRTNKRHIPRPVEARLTELSAVAACAVVGVDDPEWGQRVTAVIEVAEGHPSPGLTELADWVTDVLPAHHAPRALEVLSALERTASGKIRRAAHRPAS